MKNKSIVLFFISILVLLNFTYASADINIINSKINSEEKNNEPISENDYGLQYVMNYGSDRHYGARYEGPQPIGDCDNDGLNEMLISGRDERLRVFEWDDAMQTYLEMHTLHCPLHPIVNYDSGGFAIGDLTGDNKNEIGANWDTAIHQWKKNDYKILGFNNYRFNNGGGSADCYIGDYDTDGENELIVSGGPVYDWSPVPEIGIYKWNGLTVKKVAEWTNQAQGYTYVYMAGLGDVDSDGENEIVCGSSFKVYVLDWDKENKEFDETVIMTTGQNYYPFACVCKDSDMDGKLEIHVGCYSPLFTIFEWNGQDYEIKYQKEWNGEGAIIEGVDVGDVDDDGIAEVCVGTDLVHILQWNGTSYSEEAVLPTYGDLAVVSIGDCDNDGINEINAGSVSIDYGQDYMYWVYKYGLDSKINLNNNDNYGTLRVHVKGTNLEIPLKNASVAALNLDTNVWYDIQAEDGVFSTYIRDDLPEGEYFLRVIIEGYKIKSTTITINEGEETVHSFLLKLSTNDRAITKNSEVSFKLLRIFENLIEKNPILFRIFLRVI